MHRLLRGGANRFASRFTAAARLLVSSLAQCSRTLSTASGKRKVYSTATESPLVMVAAVGVASFSGSKTCRGSRHTIRKLFEYSVSAVAAPGAILGNLRMTKVLRLEKQGKQTRGSFTERCSLDKCLSISESGTRVRHCMRTTLSRSGSHSYLADPVTGRCSGT